MVKMDLLLPPLLLLLPPNEGVYVLSCLLILYVFGGRVGGKKGVQHWGMCTCNFSSFDTVGLL